MTKLFLFAVTVVIAVQCQHTVEHKYNPAVFDKIYKAGQEAESLIQVGKPSNREEKQYFNNQANDFYYYTSSAASILNAAVFSEGIGGSSQNELADVTKQLSESACSLFLAINKSESDVIKKKLNDSIELAKDKIEVLSRIASEVDKIQGGKPIEFYIHRATKALQRGFYQIISRHALLEKTTEQILDRFNSTRAKALAKINAIPEDEKTAAKVLKDPVANLVDILKRLIQKISELLYNEESISNGNAVREQLYKLQKLHVEVVQHSNEYEYVKEGSKLKENCYRLSVASVALLKELRDLFTATTGSRILSEIILIEDVGLQLLFYYLELEKLA